MGIDIMYLSNVRDCLPAIADADFQIQAHELFPDAGAPAEAILAPTGAGDPEPADGDEGEETGGDLALGGRSRGPRCVSFAGCT